MKYSPEVRIEVVKEIENGDSIRGVASKYGIAKSAVHRWFIRYQQHGIEGLIVTKQDYSADFRIKAVEYLLNNDVSLDRAAAILGIYSQTLAVWKHRFQAEGIAGLRDIREGRPSKMPKKTNKSSKPLSKEEQYEARIKELEMENAYLKKLNALVAERGKSEKKTK